MLALFCLDQSELSAYLEQRPHKWDWLQPLTSGWGDSTWRHSPGDQSRRCSWSTTCHWTWWRSRMQWQTLLVQLGHCLQLYWPKRRYFKIFYFFFNILHLLIWEGWGQSMSSGGCGQDWFPVLLTKVVHLRILRCLMVQWMMKLELTCLVQTLSLCRPGPGSYTRHDHLHHDLDHNVLLPADHSQTAGNHEPETTMLENRILMSKNRSRFSIN